MGDLEGETEVGAPREAERVARVGVACGELQPLARAAEVRLELLAAWTWLVESEVKPRALVALLNEAEEHGDYGRSVVRGVLPSFSWPELDLFLDQAGGDGAAWEVFVAGMEHVAPGILTGRSSGNAESLFSRFAQLLTDVGVEEGVKKPLVRILRSCASPRTDGADLAWIVMELGRGTSAAEAEELARRVYVAVVSEDDTNVRSWAVATEWLLAHPFAVEGDPSAWRLYLNIVRLHPILKLSGLSPERVSDYRVQALRCLAELAPIALPEQVREIGKQLYDRFSNQAKEPDPAAREAAIAALRRIQQRNREAQAEGPVERPRDDAPSETATRLGAPEWTSWPTPAGEAIIRFATSPRFPPLISLPIHDSLTVSPGSGPIPPVSRMDASKGGLGPAAAPPPDLDLSSYQIAANSGGDGFTPTRFSTAASAVPADLSELAVPRESLDGARDFARSTEMNREARRVFQEELAYLAGRVYPRDRLEELISQINQKCESLSSVLREPGGQVVTLRISEASDQSNQVKMVPLHDTQAVIRSQVLPPFEVVSIESLSGPEKVVVRARMLGEGQAGLLTTEQRSRGGKAAAARMTAEERRERASKAAKIQSTSMTPEQRKERASKAAKARHDRRHASDDE